MRRIVASWRRALVLALAASSAFAADAPALEIPIELWDRPRSGRIVMALPAVRQAVGALNASPALRLAIRHAPGPEPTLQADELKAWLVAHAIAPGRIVLQADPAARTLRLEVGSEARP